jgi:sphingomyelin phosphodiesterase acid-like 3
MVAVACLTRQKEKDSMFRTSRLLLLLMLVNVGLSGGCGISTSAPPPTNEPTFPVIVFSDIHFNPLDDPTLCTSLAAADPSAWTDIFKGSLKPPALPPLHSDTNYLLLGLALSSIKQNVSASPVVIFAGDLLVHKISTLFYQACLNFADGQVPTEQQVVAMQAFADKTATFVMQQARASVGNVPIMFVVGNNDSYTGLGPDSVFLANTLQPYYTNFVNGTAADYPAFFNTFTSGGYYSAQPLGSSLMVIGLNTNLFATLPTGIPGNDGAAYAELAWLDTTLDAAQTAGQKVWLLMHVPPGADTCTSAANLASDGSLTNSNAAMMWMPAYQESFLQILAKYPGVITLSLGGTYSSRRISGDDRGKRAGYIALHQPLLRQQSCV